MSSTDPIQSYGVWLIAAVLVAAFLLVWINFQRKPRHSKELSASHIQLAPDREAKELKARWRTLTSRQEQVALLAAKDLSDEEIARRLGITVRTVESHLFETHRKLNIHSRRELKYMVQQVVHDAD